MARGCVPVVTDIPSGIPEFVRDGVNGYVAPVGAIEQFADRLALLHRDPNRRRQLSRNAYEMVVKGGYRIEDVTVRYLDLFRKVLCDAESGAFERPVRELYMPRWVTLRYPEEPPRPKTWKDSLPPVVRRLGRYSKRSLRLARSAVSRVCGSKADR
jgi:hypothetical protein